MNFTEKLIVAPGRKIDVRDIDPSEDFGWGKKNLDRLVERNTRGLMEYQYKIYAENRQSLLLVFQAMDAGGKDGTINHVLYAMNPQGCRSHSFKVPTKEEAEHDFLWRYHKVAPSAGEVVIFNRSHYESVLVEKVHGFVSPKEVKKRYGLINDFEKTLLSNRTTILKFFLHISKEEQLKRFKDRLDDKRKHWKISESDYTEREYWDDYMKAFNGLLNHCSTKHAPWFVIPSNNKEFRNLAVSEIILDAMKHMKPALPETTADLNRIRKLYYPRAAKKE